ncbi:g7944 [Coccomyxa viridis]|uniref:G7944 protein n=1 Tax=Coccomyxa viridis TaxID=1274662 RepID=A0ABP1G405_9CHLO
MRCASVALLFAFSALASLSRAAPGLRTPTWTEEELDQATQDLCREHGLPEATQKLQIYDAFMFNSELDMLEVQLLELYDFVDYCDRPKPLHYAENRQRFARFASKIIHVTLDKDPQDKARYRKWQRKVIEKMSGSAAMPRPSATAIWMSPSTGSAGRGSSCRSGVCHPRPWTGTW